MPDNPAIAQPFSWQFIFFSGFIIGFYWPHIVKQWRKLSIQLRKSIGWLLVAAFLLTATATFILVFGHELGGTIGPQIDRIHHIIEQGFNKDRLPLPRILMGVVWFWGLFYFMRRFESWFIKHLGWLFLSFGVHSLYVYTISAFVVFIIRLVVVPLGDDTFIINLLVSLLALALVYLAVRTKFLMKIIPR